MLGPHDSLRVTVEAASSLGWHKWIGRTGVTVTVDGFGACGAGEEILELFGCTPEHVCEVIRSRLSRTAV